METIRKRVIVGIVAFAVLIAALFAGDNIDKKRRHDDYVPIIDYNDSSYGDFYVVSEKRTGKENIKILIIRDDEYNEYVIVLNVETGDIEGITRH